ncbi:uridylate kinase [Spiroplasma sabaudiense Ar-1343]|uniref:Uridylate kinase n=1 Tax=Spiroplasma sabaudiense Ar-1343 TaxID=1276257 RepID=W6AIU9_9MOLU|nr:UMP kinase [Spiroplasma sabaudiense]AHI53634.1 uridylate kinase [Spiroplasma sabaudiense Ar-1343]
MSLKYKRVLLKISGEALKGQDIYDQEKVQDVARQIITLVREGLQIGVVVGGGNIWRGNLSSNLGMDRINGDYMGMMATIMNGLALEATIKSLGYEKVRVYSALEIKTVTTPYNYREARDKLNNGYILIFTGGTGFSYFTTDTGASIRAIEIKADALLMAKNGVKGVYDDDPRTNPKANFLKTLTHREVAEKKLRVMDLTSATLSADAKLKIEVFDMNGENNIIKMAHGDLDSTTIQ